MRSCRHKAGSMKGVLGLMLAALTVLSTTAWGQAAKREPHIGYLYPSGGQRGTVVRILAGGQFLRDVTDAHISGEGVQATVIKHYRPLNNLDRDERLELQRRMRERWIALAGDGRLPPILRRGFAKRGDQSELLPQQKVKLPDHPLFEGLDSMSLRDLQHRLDMFTNFRKRQINRQIGESVLIELTIDPGAEPGDRELRLVAKNGLTNPLCFQVGRLPEVKEQEPNDPNAPAFLGEPEPIELPVLLNGQIMPGDVDRFNLRARRGQRLVIDAYARRLIPYLADAVPGWFQAIVALYDAQGNEVAYADDFRFQPDPIFFYEIPRDGDYVLEIRDSIYRGREDFVYRVAVSENPYITAPYPLGGRAGVSTMATLGGWNLPRKHIFLDTEPGGGSVRQATLLGGDAPSNPMIYAVDTFPESMESEPNNTPAEAQRVEWPTIVNGLIGAPGDVDLFEFEGRAGDEVVAEVVARRLYSPLDSLLRLSDASGQVLEWNDDYVDKDGYLYRGAGLLTHHADSYLRARLPEDGVYRVYVGDSQQHGGDAYAYRLHVAPPRPDFELRVTPSSLSVPVGRAVPISVHALRKDGFDGPIELSLKNAPVGFTLDGGHIMAGQNRVRMTVTAPSRPIPQPVPLAFEGQAQINGETVTHTATPADDTMQAFLWRHLVPAQELLITVTGARRGGPPVRLARGARVQIPVGGKTEVRVRVPKGPRLQDIHLALNEPPEGLSIEGFRVVQEGLAFTLKADAGTAQAGVSDNLIVDASMDVMVKTGKKGEPKKKRRVPVGVLPAIPFEIVTQ
ncbi:MAG: hypothetical protein GWP08_08960 [Nitrospiraceae bacterium]|nr:hypothetical protein [Nitrospiraceae bacterium]